MKEDTTNKRERILKKYNSSAPFYERRYKSIQYKKYLHLFLEFKLGGKIILNVRCGTGLLIDFLNEEQYKEKKIPLSYVGVDISNKMLDKFNEKKEELNILSNKINLIQTDLENLPLRSNKFNALISITSYQNVSNIKKGINESIRASKSGAEACISILKESINNSRFLSLIEPQIDDVKIINNQLKI